jgi:hypothetical protein
MSTATYQLFRGYKKGISAYNMRVVAIRATVEGQNESAWRSAGYIPQPGVWNLRVFR